MQCSMVSMESAPLRRAVRRVRLVTCWTRAGMRTGRERSVRTKTMPWPTGAGLKVRVVAWQWGRDREPMLQTAAPVDRVFRILRR